jgi:hypothetical protein
LKRGDTAADDAYKGYEGGEEEEREMSKNSEKGSKYPPRIRYADEVVETIEVCKLKGGGERGLNELGGD